MAPIGASDTWQWHSYDHGCVEVEGERLPSVPGGSHWGGGLWADAFDHACYGLLMLARGRWRGRRLLSERFGSRPRWRPAPPTPATASCGS